MCAPRAPTVSNPLLIALFTIQLLSIWSRFHENKKKMLGPECPCPLLHNYVCTYYLIPILKSCCTDH